VVVTQVGGNAIFNTLAGLGNGFMTVTLWDTTTQTELAQKAFALPASRAWTFVDLPTPVALTAGHVYSVVGWDDSDNFGPGASHVWYLNSPGPTPPEFLPTGTIQLLTGRNGGGIGPDTFPTSTGIGTFEIGGVADIGYHVVPEPASLSVLTLAGACLLARRQKRR
jgi:hypothetical protein